MKRVPGNDNLIETHPWALGLQRRNNLTIPRGTVFQAEQTQPVPKIAGTIDPPGVYEYAVVGYYGRETKYLVVEAQEHQEAHDQYTFIIFSEKEIKYWQEKNLKLAAKTFDRCKRPLPGCDHAGFLIVTPWSPATASVPESSDAESDHGSDDECEPEYEPWPPALEKRYKLAIQRGSVFFFDQIHSKCQYHVSRLSYRVKTAGKGSETCRTGLHEYVVAGFDPREDKYYCFEAESDPLHSVLFSQATIEKALQKIDELRRQPKISFNRDYPPMPVIDNMFKIIKPGEEKERSAARPNKTSQLINPRLTRLSSFDARSHSPQPPSRLERSRYDAPVTPRMTLNPSSATAVGFDHADATTWGLPSRLSQSPMRDGSLSPMRTSPRNTYAYSNTPDMRNVGCHKLPKRQTTAAWLGTSSPELKSKAPSPLHSVQSPRYNVQRRPISPLSSSSNQSGTHINHSAPSQTASNYAAAPTYHTPYRSGSPMSAIQLNQHTPRASHAQQPTSTSYAQQPTSYSMQSLPPVRQSSYQGAPAFKGGSSNHNSFLQQLHVKQNYAEPPQGTNYPPPLPPTQSASAWLTPE